MDLHRIINTDDIYLLLWSNMENLKDNSASRLETRGLHGHGSVNVASLKAAEKFPAQNEEFWFKSSSREIYLSQSFEALNIRFKKNLSLAKLEFSGKI